MLYGNPYGGVITYEEGIDMNIEIIVGLVGLAVFGFGMLFLWNEKHEARRNLAQMGWRARR